MSSAFSITEEPNPHIRRGAEIRRRHPEVRELFGPDPWSRAAILGVVGVQILIAGLLSGAAWWLVVLVAYAVGAFASHALFVLIHDAGHNLVARGSSANRFWGIVCNVGQGFPSAMAFRTFHLLHHSHLDEYDWDGDLAFEWEARWVGHSPWRKALWLSLFSLVEVVRPFRIRRKVFDRWQLMNVVGIVATDAVVFWLFGWQGLLYLVSSTVFGLGLHPVGARWIQEHYTVVPGQETYSYYGALNRVAFNIGYHNEHHDLPAVAWRHLPKVKALAPEFYEPLYAHRSWTSLLGRWLTDPELSLFSRITRTRAPRKSTAQAVSTVEPPQPAQQAKPAQPIPAAQAAS